MDMPQKIGPDYWPLSKKAALKRHLMALAREISANMQLGAASDHGWPHEPAPKD